MKLIKLDIPSTVQLSFSSKSIDDISHILSKNGIDNGIGHSIAQDIAIEVLTSFMVNEGFIEENQQSPTDSTSRLVSRWR